MICTDCYKSFEGIGVVCPKCVAKREAAKAKELDGPFSRRAPAARTDSAELYYPMPVSQMVLLTIFTGGLFLIYWFYRSWKAIKIRDGSDIWPWARTMFYLIYCFPLYKDVAKEHGRITGEPRIPGVAASLGAFFFMSITWKFPEPLCVFSTFAVVALIPLLEAINSLNSPETIAKNGGMTFRRFILLVIMGPLTVLGTASELNLLPSSEPVRPWMMWPHQRAALEANGCLKPQEKPIFVYSGGFTFSEHAVCVTDQGIATFGVDEESGQVYKESAPWTSVSLIEKGKQGSVFDDREITIVTVEGDSFPVRLPEMKRHETDKYVNEVFAAWKKGRGTGSV